MVWLGKSSTLLGCVVVVLGDAVEEGVAGVAEELVGAASRLQGMELVVDHRDHVRVRDEGRVVDVVRLQSENRTWDDWDRSLNATSMQKVWTVLAIPQNGAVSGRPRALVRDRSNRFFIKKGPLLERRQRRPETSPLH